MGVAITSVLKGCTRIFDVQVMPSTDACVACAVTATDGVEGRLRLVSAETGTCLHEWVADSEPDRSRTLMCKPVSSTELVVLRTPALQLWDIRTSAGAVHTIVSPEPATAFDVSSTSHGAGVAASYFATPGNTLHEIDWRLPAARMLWEPSDQPSLLSVKDRALATQSLVVSAGLACMCSYGFLSCLALKPTVCFLGMASNCQLNWPVSGAGAWVFRKAGLKELALLEVAGTTQPLQARATGAPAQAEGRRKQTKMFRKFEGNNHGHHNRGAGKS